MSCCKYLSNCCTNIYNYVTQSNSSSTQQHTNQNLKQPLLNQEFRPNIENYHSVLGISPITKTNKTSLPNIPIYFETSGDPDIFPTDRNDRESLGFIEISIKLKVHVDLPKGINPEDIFIKEFEVNGVATGDYIAQTLSPISGKPAFRP